MLAHYLNNDKVSTLNLMGLVLCIGGILLHTYMKAKKQQDETKNIQTTPKEDFGALEHLLSDSDSES